MYFWSYFLSGHSRVYQVHPNFPESTHFQAESQWNPEASCSVGFSSSPFLYCWYTHHIHVCHTPGDTVLWSLHNFMSFPGSWEKKGKQIARQRVWYLTFFLTNSGSSLVDFRPHLRHFLPPVHLRSLPLPCAPGAVSTIALSAVLVCLSFTQPF